MIQSLNAVSALATALTPLFMRAAYAHDGWAWTGSGFLQLEGTITSIYIGNPMSTLDVDVAGARWRVDLAPLPATIASGLGWGVVKVGDDVIAIGRPSASNRVRAVRIAVHDAVFDLDPDRARDIFPAEPRVGQANYELVTEVDESSG